MVESSGKLVEVEFSPEIQSSVLSLTLKNPQYAKTEQIEFVKKFSVLRDLKIEYLRNEPKTINCFKAFELLSEG